MLKSLLIENYALIEKLDIGFDEGLTIITGETGAGKSILLGALGLILGQRADARVLANKESKCIIEGVFDVSGLQMEEIFRENELDYDPSTILRREINQQGKSRAFINDTPVNLQVMKLFAEKLIDIHSQHQNLLFANSSFRYNLVDAFAGTAELIDSYRKDYHQWLSLKRKMEDLSEREKQGRAELDYIKFQFDELHKAALIPGEEKELNSELEVLNNAGEIKLNLEKADYLLQNDAVNILSMMNQTMQLLQQISAFSPAYHELWDRINAVVIELKDVATEISSLKEDVEDDPLRSARLQLRFDLLQKLMHKHNVVEIEELIILKDQFHDRMIGFESLEEEIEKLSVEITTKQKKLSETATEISVRRNNSKKGLEKEINLLLGELGMPNGQFFVKIYPSGSFHINGLDEVEFLFSANLGSEPQELSKIASGGELSRLMLAVKSVISLKNLLPTIIFDEIDTGVSGETGFKMGHLLEKIAKNMQVVSVTHLPQVAARGHRHFFVYKQTHNHTTQTYVKELTHEQRILEIAQMLGGAQPGPAALRAAEELFDKRNINQN